MIICGTLVSRSGLCLIFIPLLYCSLCHEILSSSRKLRRIKLKIGLFVKASMLSVLRLLKMDVEIKVKSSEFVRTAISTPQFGTSCRIF
jgi:hypothetical protein